MTILESHIVPLQKQPLRFQEYAVGIFKSIPTKSGIKKAIKKELIFINGIRASTAKFILGTEKIELFSDGKPQGYKRLNLDLEIVYEDDFLAIINKPAGILVNGNKFKTIDNALQSNLNKSTQIDAVRPRPVHRLDFPTTGLLVVGKTARAILNLNKLFEKHQVQKTYTAICIGNSAKSGTIEILIDKKIAFTTYKILRTVASERFQFLNLIELSPSTGRRHQLRKHLSAIGNPILGDASYGHHNLILAKKGLYLHATSLKFKHPITGEIMNINCKLPKKFNKIFPEN